MCREGDIFLLMLMVRMRVLCQSGSLKGSDISCRYEAAWLALAG